jgi:hypothetical protein
LNASDSASILPPSQGLRPLRRLRVASGRRSGSAYAERRVERLKQGGLAEGLEQAPHGRRVRAGAGLAFGGGLGILAVLEEELVTRCRLVSREEFLTGA